MFCITRLKIENKITGRAIFQSFQNILRDPSCLCAFVVQEQKKSADEQAASTSCSGGYLFILL
jgi:hypothetical protein